MNELTDILGIIKKKFPHHDKLVDRLYDEDEDFRTLCRDYVSSVEALSRYTQISTEQKHTAQAYKTIVVELEKELNEIIQG